MAVLVVLVWSIGACGAAQGTAPEDMSAAEHREQAVRHDREGDAAGTAVAHPGSARGSGQSDVVIDRGASHHSEAAEHAAAAGDLDARLARACEGVAEPQQHTCPLAGGGQLTEIEGGVEILLPVSAGAAADVERLARCHAARMGVEGLDHAPSCPLAAPAVTATATAAPAGGVTLRIVAEGDEAVAEVRRRATALEGVHPATRVGRHRH